MNRIAKLITGGALTLGILSTAVSAQASQFFNFTFTGIDNVTGQLETGDVGSPFTVIAITGTVNGDAITGLSGYAGADNLLYYAGPPFVDFAGISFSTALAGDFNLFRSGDGDFSLSSSIDPVGYGGNGQPGVLSVAAVPEPVSWALLIVGFGGVGASLRHVRKVGRRVPA